MKLTRAFVLSAFVLGATAVTACGGSVEQQPQTTASAVSRAPVGQNTHGAVKMVGDALGEVSLRADQRTALEQLATDAEARHAPTVANRTDLMNTFAAMVESGNVDAAALQAKVDLVTADLEKIRTDDRAAFVKVHDLLDKDQRNEFADALEKHFKAKHGDWKEGHAKLKQLGAELNLSDDQKDKIKDIMKDAFKDARKDAKHHGFKGGHHGNPGQVSDAFREDKLDLDKAMPPIDLKAAGTIATQHLATTAQKILPLLTPEQRKIAADKIRTMAAQGDASLIVH